MNWERCLEIFHFMETFLVILSMKKLFFPSHLLTLIIFSSLLEGKICFYISGKIYNHEGFSCLWISNFWQGGCKKHIASWCCYSFVDLGKFFECEWEFLKWGKKMRWEVEWIPRGGIKMKIFLSSKRNI